VNFVPYAVILLCGFRQELSEFDPSQPGKLFNVICICISETPQNTAFSSGVGQIFAEGIAFALR